ncbi:hypothetical protein ES695_14960 [Candidatus Atribacteria bacterium 1244-E10-H5-B2]|nr:MAG: hypothetical protein ES695_14960 [Candidatus Atribacteria bacterium 1244-E10-H5-B2]
MHIAKGGYRKDLGIYVRSRMEANVARYFNLRECKWEYEPLEYCFDKIKRGQRYYKPDFIIYYLDDYFLFEVKGYFRPEDKTKLRRFRKYYPTKFVRLKFIIPDKYARSKANGEMIKFLCDDLEVDFEEILSYKEMEKWSKLIPGWE